VGCGDLMSSDLRDEFKDSDADNCDPFVNLTAFPVFFVGDNGHSFLSFSPLTKEAVSFVVPNRNGLTELM